MNGLFFGNTATGGGVDPRYPKILIDTIVIVYNACCYFQLADMVSDDFTPYNKMKYSFSSNLDKASVRKAKELLLFSNNRELESDILTMTVTDLDGFSTTKDLLIIINSYTYEPTTFSGNGNCSFDILTLYPNLQSDFFDDEVYLVDSSSLERGANGGNLNLKLNGTVVDIKPKKSGELTGYIYIANPTKQELLTIEYTINN